MGHLPCPRLPQALYKDVQYLTPHPKATSDTRWPNTAWVIKRGDIKTPPLCSAHGDFSLQVQDTWNRTEIVLLLQPSFARIYQTKQKSQCSFYSTKQVPCLPLSEIHFAIMVMREILSSMTNWGRRKEGWNWRNTLSTTTTQSQETEH